ncbi:MAG: quinolinate synthase NadA, partial [Solirubrobacterales bacterium]|nr:quinolinate synthase NadA [Solirubrobacterales bacterium]
LHPLRQASPQAEFIAANEAAHCRFMKMITLPKLRESLLGGVHEVKVPEDVAAGDIVADGVHMLSTGGMLRYAEEHPRATAIVATETGMLHPLRQASPQAEFIAANEAAHCRFMKMITLPKLREALLDGVHEVKVPEAIADRARVPIERMVAIS